MPPSVSATHVHGRVLSLAREAGTLEVAAGFRAVGGAVASQAASERLPLLVLGWLLHAAWTAMLARTAHRLRGTTPWLADAPAIQSAHERAGWAFVVVSKLLQSEQNDLNGSEDKGN